jgi:hypothetical protein
VDTRAATEGRGEIIASGGAAFNPPRIIFAFGVDQTAAPNAVSREKPEPSGKLLARFGQHGRSSLIRSVPATAKMP